MVRLEKILYERVFNSKLLGRARRITHPTRINANEELILQEFPLTQFLVESMPFRARVYLLSCLWSFNRWVYVTKGLGWNDTARQTEEQLRRCPVWEHVVRENMNPYHFNLGAWKRQAFFKIDGAVDGFYAQEEIQERAKKLTWIKERRNILEFKKLMNLYYNEAIPNTHWSFGRFAGLLDGFLFMNIFLRMGWNRYFYNEEHYVSAEKVIPDHFGNANARDRITLNTKEGEAPFSHADQEKLKYIHKMLPGLIAPDGQEIDFEELRRDFMAHDEFVLDGVDDVLGRATLFLRSHKIPEMADTQQKELVETPNNVGTEMPEAMNRKVGTSIM